MDERIFVNKKREAWDQLTALVDKANGRRGIRALNRAEIVMLGPLYRRASSDLAYARAHAVSDDLILHLNGLVGRAHALLYDADTSGNAFRAVVDFYMYEFPGVLQRRSRYFLAALGLTLLGFGFAYWLVITQPAKIDVFIPPQFKSSVDMWKSGKISEPPSAVFGGYLMTHNFQVGMMCFATGFLGGVPTAWLLFNNGATLGALSALMTQVHHHDTFWPGILPHGIAELTAIFICGGAGVLLGLSLLLPGPYRRGDALLLAGRDAIKLVLGTIPLFIFAGIIEGNFSHLPLPAAVRLSFAGINGVMWYLYLFLPRRRAGGGSELADTMERKSLRVL